MAGCELVISGSLLILLSHEFHHSNATERQRFKRKCGYKLKSMNVWSCFSFPVDWYWLTRNPVLSENKIISGLLSTIIPATYCLLFLQMRWILYFQFWCRIQVWLEYLSKYTSATTQEIKHIPGSKVHGANMGPTWVLSAPDGPHVGPMTLAIRDLSLGHHWESRDLRWLFIKITRQTHISSQVDHQSSCTFFCY